MASACDLHTHSIFSDGTFTPEELVDAAEKISLSHIALCDHNTINGLDRFLSAGQGRNVYTIAGCEFSSDYLGSELHILGLFIPKSAFPVITERLCEYHRLKSESNISLVNSLCKAGYKLNYEQLISKSPSGQINRANIAAELTRLGYTDSIKAAFRELLSQEAGHFVPPARPSALETISFIRDIGALPVWAHPFLSLETEKVAEFLPQAKQNGLMAMECAYPGYSAEETRLAHELCERFLLLKSGGSDFHGNNKPHISLAVGTGNLFVPSDWADALQKQI